MYWQSIVKSWCDCFPGVGCYSRFRSDGWRREEFGDHQCIAEHGGGAATIQWTMFEEGGVQKYGMLIHIHECQRSLVPCVLRTYIFLRAPKYCDCVLPKIALLDGRKFRAYRSRLLNQNNCQKAKREEFKSRVYWCVFVFRNYLKGWIQLVSLYWVQYLCVIIYTNSIVFHLSDKCWCHSNTDDELKQKHYPIGRNFSGSLNSRSKF